MSEQIPEMGAPDALDDTPPRETASTAATPKDNPRPPAFGVERVHRLGVFRALTDLEPASDPHWYDLNNPWRGPTFDTYDYGEVRLNIPLMKRDRGSGAWVGVLAGAWRKLAVTDPAEAWERLSGLGFCPSPGVDTHRFFASTCAGCGGSGFQQREAAAVGELGPVRTLRRHCDCLPARIGSRKRGRGYGLSESPHGYDALNALAHWAMLGTKTIATAEEILREMHARAMPAGSPRLRYVAWLPVVPRTWAPIAPRRVGSPLEAALYEQTRGVANALVRSSAAARFRDRRAFGRVGNPDARLYLRQIDYILPEPPAPDVCDPLRRLLDLGLALHDLDTRASVAVIAYPVQ